MVGKEGSNSNDNAVFECFLAADVLHLIKIAKSILGDYRELVEKNERQAVTMQKYGVEETSDDVIIDEDSVGPGEVYRMRKSAETGRELRLSVEHQIAFENKVCDRVLAEQARLASTFRLVEEESNQLQSENQELIRESLNLKTELIRLQAEKGALEQQTSAHRLKTARFQEQSVRQEREYAGLIRKLQTEVSELEKCADGLRDRLACSDADRLCLQ